MGNIAIGAMVGVKWIVEVAMVVVKRIAVGAMVVGK